jgi:ankyrin repeat protein
MSGSNIAAKDLAFFCRMIDIISCFHLHVMMICFRFSAITRRSLFTPLETGQIEDSADCEGAYSHLYSFEDRKRLMPYRAAVQLLKALRKNPFLVRFAHDFANNWLSGHRMTQRFFVETLRGFVTHLIVSHLEDLLGRSTLTTLLSTSAPGPSRKPSLWQSEGPRPASDGKIARDHALSAGILGGECESDLLCASASGLVKEVRQLLDKGIDAEVRDGYMMTPLLSAASRNRANVVKLLIRRNADVNCIDILGNTALHWGCFHGCTEIVEDLVAAGANVNAREKVLEATPLMTAAASGMTREARILIGAGADPDLNDVRGMTALLIAVHFNHVELVRELLESGANCQQCNHAGKTSLMLAAEKGNREMLRLLLGTDSDVNQTDTEGRTALHIAILNEKEDIVTDLLSAGASVRAIDRYGRTAFALAKSYRMKDFLGRQ